jgi:hypothetical protein
MSEELPGLLPGAFSVGRTFKKKYREAQRLGGGKVHARRGSLCSEVKMVLFSRSFIRKRAIALAATASVAMASLVLVHAPSSAHRIRATTPIQYVADWQNSSDEAPFLAENQAAMNKMMADMAVKPTGDVDRDFVAMMVPHHQGAVEMARAELKYGHNELLRRLARLIVKNQQQEITVMRLAVDDERTSSTGSPAQPPAQPQPGAHDGMLPREGMSISQ